MYIWLSFGCIRVWSMSIFMGFIGHFIGFHWIMFHHFILLHGWIMFGHFILFHCLWSCLAVLSCFIAWSCFATFMVATHFPPLWFAPVPPDSVVPCGHANAVALSVVNKPAAINVLIFFIFVCSMKALVPVIKLAIIRKNRSYNIVWDPNGSGVHMLFNAVFKLGLSL